MAEPDETLPSVLFAEKFRAARIRSGLTQKQVADRISMGGKPITQAFISNLERGHVNPPIDSCALLAAAVDLKFLFDLV